MKTMKTIEQVWKMFPDTIKENWHQHNNGKGWVYSTARVDDSAYVGSDAQVSGDAQVYGNARVSGDAQVSGDARVSGSARVYGNARVSGDARVYGNARVSGDAQVYGNAWVSGSARVSGDAWVLSPLYIQGSRHSLTLASFTEIAIGCHLHTISFWKDNYEKIGQTEGYTVQQVEEYLGYILLCEQYAARYCKK